MNEERGDGIILKETRRELMGSLLLLFICTAVCSFLIYEMEVIALTAVQWEWLYWPVLQGYHICKAV